jgi:putative ATPase
MDSLFDAPEEETRSASGEDESVPLAERLRPRTLEQLVGQTHLLGPGKPLRRAIEADRVPSMILWGPPGTGKTTLGRIVAHVTRSRFQDFSAVLSGIREVREVMNAAKRLHRTGERTILFVDEIHRFNKAQQDAFLPFVESGTITLIGATTENPSFEVNAALLSRLRVFVLNALSDEEVRTLLQRAEGTLGLDIAVEALEAIVTFANGDARSAYNVLEMAEAAGPGRRVTREIVREVVQKKLLQYDKAGEEHFNIISALHKSIRNSDADAGLYWLARMLEAGEDPLYIARRLVRFASEDVGLADPQALGLAIDAKDAVQFLGMPEGNLALAQLVVYLAAAPKSNSIYRAYGAVSDEIASGRADPVPLHLRNAPTKLMKTLDYGKGYRYAHDEAGGVADMDCLPDRLRGRRFYQPRESGEETGIARRLDAALKKRNRPKAGEL